MKKYGSLPKNLGEHLIECDEMLYYQYLPIKLSGQVEPLMENRLIPFKEIIGAICCDFVGEFGLDKYVRKNVYLTAKKMYQTNGCSFNRKGYHSDGFLTYDINYIWSDCQPTIFNTSNFNLTLDDKKSLKEMEDQALKKNEVIYPNNTLLRLNQFQIHKVSPGTQLGLRTFVKVSFSEDKYDLKGNSVNHLLDYDWKMRDRETERNIPQKIK